MKTSGIDGLNNSHSVN